MANNRIVHKRTSTSGLLPNTTNSSNSAYIAASELAVNLTDRKVVTSTGSVPFEVGANLTSLYVGTGEITANATHLKLGSAALFANGSNGTSGQVLTSNGTSAYWGTASGGGGTPGGSTTQIQFNDAGSFAGQANLTFDKTTALVTVGNTTVNAQFYGNTGDIPTNQITTTALALTANSAGFRGSPSNERTGDYTFTIQDSGKSVVHLDTGINRTWTVPNNASVPFPVGTMIVIDNSYYSALAGVGARVSITGVSTGVGIRNTETPESISDQFYFKRVTKGNVATIKKLAQQGTSTRSIASITGDSFSPFTPLAVMATSNTLAQIDLYVGDYVIIEGASVAAHNGLHRILSTSGTGGTAFSISINTSTLNSSGTITVRRAELWSISGTYSENNS
jgi:hypothetical protein